MRFHKWRTWFQSAALISSQRTRSSFLNWEKAQLFINRTLKQHRSNSFTLQNKYVVRRHAEVKCISCLVPCGIAVNTVHSIDIQHFTCHAENISCKNLSSRSGLAVTNHCQHSMAVVIAGSVKSSTCDHATTCSRLRYTPTQWNYAVSYANLFWK